jgi:L-threonylcarbamoyladenylate synthase
MKIIEFSKIREREIINHIRKGSIFVYPTDTIYGLGCNALDESSVKKITKLKKKRQTFFCHSLR